VKHLSFFILILLIVASGCKQSSDVVGNGFLQKRKYRPGLHFQKKADKLQRQKDFEHAIEDTVIADNHTPFIPKPSKNQVQSEPIEVVSTATRNIRSILRHKPQREYKNKPPKSVSNDHSLEVEPEISEESKNTNLYKLLACYVLAVLSGIYIAGIYVLGMVGISAGIFSLGIPIMVMIILVVGLLSIFYLIEIIANSKDKTIFTPKFRKVMGGIALGLSILAAIALIATGGILGVLIGWLVMSIDLVEAFALLLLTGLIGAVLVAIYAIILWPTITSIILSFKETLSSKIAIGVQLLGLLLATILFFIMFGLQQ
jgi:hypothetical protein